MIKLNKQVESLESLIEKLNEKVFELEAKKEAIIDNACEHDREITEAEVRRIDKLEEQMDELMEEADSIQNAIDYLRDYTD